MVTMIYSPAGGRQKRYPMGIRKVKAIELIIDWSLWPRHEANGLDSTNLARMKEALKNDVELPPVIVNVADMRVIDGFHRVKAHLSVFGDDATIRADMQVFDSEAEMFLAATRLNAIHGLPLSPKDRAHAILRARKLKVPPAAIADAIGMTSESMKSFLEKRTAKSPSGETVALPGGARHLAGKSLSDDQMHYVEHVNGTIPEMYANMLLNALRADALDLTEKTIAKLAELRDAITEVIG